jgi:hypothetical protein
MPLTDEDRLRDLLHRGTPWAEPPISMAREVAARQRRRDRRGRVASLAAAGTAVGVAAAVTGHALQAKPAAPAVRPAIKLTSAQRVLYRLSSAAAGQAPGRGRYVVMSTEGFDDHVLEVRDTSVIDSRTGDMWSYQKGTGGAPSGTAPVSRHFSPTAAQFAAMPTALAPLRAALIAQWNVQNRPTSAESRQLAKLRHGRPIPTPIPIRHSAADKVFQQASNLLWNPLIGPRLRSALFKVLAATPGVQVDPHARDLLGRPAVEISRTDNSGLPGNRSDKIVVATFENPATGAVLESLTVYPPGSDEVSPQDPNGTRTDAEADVYLSVSRSVTVMPNPYTG